MRNELFACAMMTGRLNSIVTSSFRWLIANCPLFIADCPLPIAVDGTIYTVHHLKEIMGDVQNLESTSAKHKIKEIVEDTNICLFTTNLTELPLSSRPMSTQKVDDDGTLWFFSEKDSEKNRHIEADGRVQLFYANRNSSEFLSIYGNATVIKDDAKARELWSPISKTWFQEGPEDPSLTILKVIPEDGYYWDTKDGKIVSMLKIAAGAITGREMDGGVQGALKV